MESDVKNSFRKVQPICVRLAKKYNTEDVKLLKLALEEIELDVVSLQMLLEYVIFPIRLNISREKDTNIIIECLNFLSAAFRQMTVTSWSTFCDILGQVMNFVVVNSNISHNPSEELTLAVSECALSLILNCSEDIQYEMFGANYCLALGQYLYSLLTYLKREKSKTLRLAILDCIASMLYCKDDMRKTNQVKNRVRARVAAFLPGVSIALRDIICGDDKQGHKIVVNAINLLSELICLVFEDDSLSADSLKESGFPVHSKLKDIIVFVKRNESWVQETAPKLLTIVEKMAMLTCHNNWKVRLALAQCSQNILCHCTISLQICMLPLLQILLALSVDHYKQVSDFSQLALKQFSEHAGKIKSFNAILKEDMNTISSKLIRIHLSTNDQEKLSLLKTILGYLQILGPSDNNLLYSHANLNQLLITILNLIRFDTTGIIFSEQDFIPIDFSVQYFKLWPKKMYRYFHEDEIICRVRSICYVLGHYGDIQLLVDYLIEKMQNSELKNEAIFLISSIISGLDEKICSDHIILKHENLDLYTEKDYEFKIEIIKTILEEFLLPINFEISSNNVETTTNIVLQSEKQCDNHNDILRICLILESISIFAHVLEHKFQPLLMSVLCPVMEKAGNVITVISHCGKLALSNIAYCCGCSSVSKLIEQNIDYLINSITIGFCHFVEKSEMAVVLKVALEQSDVDILPLLKDPIDQLLMYLDYNQGKALSIMPILLSVMIAIKRWFPKKMEAPYVNLMETAEVNDSESNFDDMLLECRDLIQSTLHSKETISGSIKDPKNEFVDDEKVKPSLSVNVDKESTHENKCEKNLKSDTSSHLSDSEDYLKNNTFPEKEKTSFHFKIASAILERCIHLQSSENLELRVLTLSIIDNAILALRSVIDDVLPYVHRIWSPLVVRFSGELIVMKKAFETLLIIADECGDFIQRRTVKDVWPKLLNFLKMQKNVYVGKGNFSNYQLSNSYKFLLFVLSEIGHLASKLDVSEREYEMLLWHCFPFIERNQPETLQMAAMKSLNILLKIDPDAFYFYYHEAFSDVKDISPTNKLLFDVHFYASQPMSSLKYQFDVRENFLYK